MVADSRLAEMHLPRSFREAQVLGHMQKRFNFQ
jgi:hypothetical protein